MFYQTKDAVLAASGTMLGLSTVAVGFRLWTRKKQQAPVMADDGLAVMSLALYVGAAIVVFIMVHYKIIGYSLSSAASGEMSSTCQVVWNIFSTTSLAVTKLSALFFYRRIFCVGGKFQWMNITTIITMGVVVLRLAIFLLLMGFRCGTHFSALWDGSRAKYCTISYPFLYGFTISELLLDIWILSLPVPNILQLHAPRSKKLATLGVFLLAFIGIGVHVVRMVQYIGVEKAGEDYFLDHDKERATTGTICIAMLETGISLVAVNLPSLWFLLASIAPGKIVRTVHSVIALSFLRSGRDGTATAGFTGIESPATSTRPSQSSGRFHLSAPDMRLCASSSKTLHADDTEAQKMDMYTVQEEGGVELDARFR